MRLFHSEHRFTVGSRKLTQGHLICEPEDRHWPSSFVQIVLVTTPCCLYTSFFSFLLLIPLYGIVGLESA